MSFDNPWLVTGLVLIGLLVVVWFVVAALRPHPIFVPEGQQVVVFQLGRFHRIDGPGPVMLNRQLDEVVRTINIRNEPDNYRVDGLLSYGLPFGYTLNFWRHTDLTTAAGMIGRSWCIWRLLSDDERQHQVVTLLRTTLLDSWANWNENNRCRLTQI